MSKTATATIRVEIEYQVNQEFDDDVSLDDMRDDWDTFIELDDGCMPSEWEYVEVEVTNIEEVG